MSKTFQLFIFIVITTNCLAGDLQDNASINFFDSVAVNDTVIRIHDIGVIDSKLSINQNEAIGNIIVGESAPPGFTRKINTDDVFTNILRHKPCNGNFNRFPSKNIKVATVFIEKKISDFSDVITRYMADSVSWPQNDYSVQIKTPNEKLRLYNMPFTASVSGLTTKNPKGSVNLKLKLNQIGKALYFPVSCIVTVSTQVVVAKGLIRKGDAFTENNCTIEKRDITKFNNTSFVNTADIKNLVAFRTISSGSIIHEKLTSKIPLVHKNEQVYVISGKGNVRVSMIMFARESGALGDWIWVENDLSHKLMKTKVIGKGQVELLRGREMI